MNWCCRCLCGVLVVVLALILATPPASLVCYAYTACPMEKLGPFEVSSDLSPKGIFHMFANIVARRFSSSSDYVIVHIAPSVTDESDTLPPAGAKALFPNGGVFLVYAEPNKEVLRQWREQLLALGLPPNEAAFVQAAVCDHDSEAATLYRGSQQLFFDYLPGQKPSILLDHATTNRTRLLRWLRMLSSELQAVGAEKLASYVENETVRCVTPASLLKEAKVRPEAVEQFHVDVYGEDALEMVDAFMSLDGFRPHTVGFEFRGHHNYEPETHRLIHRLVATFSERGYNVHRANDDLMMLLAA